MKTFDQLKPGTLKRKKWFAESDVKLLLDLEGMRRDKGLSLRQCAEASGLDHATLYRIERGAAPSLAAAIRFSQFIGKPIQAIWKLKEV